VNVTIDQRAMAGLLKAKERIWNDHGRDPNVNAAGVGYRRIGGQVTTEPAVIVMVTDKIPAAALSSRRLMPETIEVDGIRHRVDVVEAGPFYSAVGRQPAAAPQSIENTGPIKEKFRPLVMGCGVSNADASSAYTGTLGCFVQDNDSEDIYLLSAGDVLSLAGTSGSMDAVIIQPAVLDKGTLANDSAGVLELFTPLTDGITVDGGIATLVEVEYDASTVAHNLMEPPSATHLAVGMCIACDPLYENSMLARMDTTLTSLDVSIVGSESDEPWTIAPAVGMDIEKVGRTSGYTSSTVDAVGVSVTIDFLLPGTGSNGAAEYKQVTMNDMIWSQFLFMPGDGGAVALQGGNGRTFVPVWVSPCALISSVESYYTLPGASTNNKLTNQIQSQFLSKSGTGSFFVGLVYMNAHMAAARLAADTGSAYDQAAAAAYVQGLYAKYEPLITATLADPDSFTFTNDQITDFAYLAKMLYEPPAQGGQGIITADEYGAAIELGLVMSGMVQNGITSYAEILNYMNEAQTYVGMFNLFSQVPTLEMP
jgi:hypothetical protein